MEVDPTQPKLLINGVLVKFKDAEQHAAYIAFESQATYQEWFDHFCSSSGQRRRAAKRRLDMARQAAYTKWKKENPA